MLSKKFGYVLIVLSILLGFVMFFIWNSLNDTADKLGCYPSPECARIQPLFTFTNLVLGVLAFLLSLGFYISFLSRTEESIIKRLENDSKERLSEEKYSILIRGLDEHERKILSLIRGQPGITQATLRFKVDLSKAKVSEVVSGLEKKKLVRKKEAGKTYNLYFAESI